MRLVITGGSGFIGTNLIEKLRFEDEYNILNIDIKPPKLKDHNQYWVNVNICDKVSLYGVIEGFQPDYVIHLAARTDLNGKSLSDYDANIMGVKNMIDVLNSIGSVKRVIFTSSMYVCYPGYKPINFEDYTPHTVYGESKVLSEKIIKQCPVHNYEWVITRPTSIWGPWFGEPYINFFKIVNSHKYFHMGMKACTKTYGYIENTIEQIMCLLKTPKTEICEKVFYLGDFPPYNISEWANEIALELNIRIPNISFSFFYIAALVGDILRFVNINFPITSFRLKNMTTDNIHDLEPILNISKPIITRKEGVVKTLNWLKEYA
jgi:nucleoside-diphosphate-sugar epimerase